MLKFDVKESLGGNFINILVSNGETVDIGIVLGGMRRFHADMMLISEILGSEPAVDQAHPLRPSR